MTKAFFASENINKICVCIENEQLCTQMMIILFDNRGSASISHKEQHLFLLRSCSYAHIFQQLEIVGEVVSQILAGVGKVDMVEIASEPPLLSLMN